MLNRVDEFGNIRPRILKKSFWGAVIVVSTCLSIHHSVAVFLFKTSITVILISSIVLLICPTYLMFSILKDRNPKYVKVFAVIQTTFFYFLMGSFLFNAMESCFFRFLFGFFAVLIGSIYPFQSCKYEKFCLGETKLKYMIQVHKNFLEDFSFVKNGGTMLGNQDFGTRCRTVSDLYKRYVYSEIIAIPRCYRIKLTSPDLEALEPLREQSSNLFLTLPIPSCWKKQRLFRPIINVRDI